MKRPASSSAPMKRPASAAKKSSEVVLQDLATVTIAPRLTVEDYRAKVTELIVGARPEYPSVKVGFNSKGPGAFFDRFYCVSCERQTCPFRGTAKYNPSTGTVHIRPLQ